MVLFHSRRRMGQLATISAVTGWELAMYVSWQ